MANELIKMKTGTIAKLEQETSGAPTVALDRGTIYFAVDTENHKGKIVYDAPVGTAGVDRIVMGTDSEYADYAGEAAKTTGITGIYPVRGTQTQATNLWTGSISGVSELVDGLTIAYYLPYNGNTTAATLQLNFEDNGTYSASVPIYYTGTTALTAQYGAGSTIILTYWATENRWSRADYNIDGAVTGPTNGSVSDNQVAIFDGTTGKVIKGGVSAHSYTPAGTITVNGTTSTATVVKTATFKNVITGASVTDGVLTFTWDASGSSTNQGNVRIADPAYKFTGTAATLSHTAA